MFVYCAAIPIGIETEQFTKMLKDANVIEAIRKLKAQFAKRKVNVYHLYRRWLMYGVHVLCYTGDSWR